MGRAAAFAGVGADRIWSASEPLIGTVGMAACDGLRQVAIGDPSNSYSWGWHGNFGAHGS